MQEWSPDETATIENCTSWCTALLWIVPAKAEGTWKLPQGELKLKQTFQVLTGTFEANGRSTPVTDGKLNGDQISFSVAGDQYTGHVNGTAIDGTVNSGGKTNKWGAKRAG